MPICALPAVVFDGVIDVSRYNGAIDWPAVAGAGGRHRAADGSGGKMRWKAGAALALVLLAGGCSGAGQVCRCPKPVAYDDATLKKIEKAREALPRDNIIQKILVDYENERDDLRFCGAQSP